MFQSSIAQSTLSGPRPAPNLNAMIKSETGLDVSVDQGEITDIVLGKKLSPTAFDFEMLRETWSEYDRRVRAEEGRLSSTSPTEAAIEGLSEEAKAWIASQGGVR